MRIDSSGRLLVGTSGLISDNWAGNNETIQTAKSGLNSLTVLAGTAFTSAHASYLGLNRARGSLASPTIVSNGDTLGGISFSGYDGSAFLRSAAIEGFVDATPGANDMPSRLGFFTTPDGSASPTERMRIDSSGNVLIGTTSPNALYGKLTVAGNGITIADDGNAKFQIGRYSAGVPNSYIKMGANSSSLRFTDPADLADLMTLDSSGNVGIGTSSPSTVLNVKKDQSDTTAIKVENPNAGTGAVTTFQAAADVASLAVGVDSSTKIGTLWGLNRTSLASIISFSDSALGVGTFGATPLVLGTNNTERMRIDASGNVSIASTDSNGLNTARLHSNDSQFTGGSNTTTRATQRASLSAYQDGGSSNDSGSYCSLVLRLNGGLAVNPGQLMRGYGGNGGDTYNIQIAQNGNITNTNNSYGSLSDVSLKENIVDATPKLNDLMAVQIRNYNHINDEKKTKQIGVIAQELEQIFPAMITTESDGLKSVKYSVFVPMLVKAIQELKAELDTVKAELATLKG
jgi:trimeric autotransporter adhesin